MADSLGPPAERDAGLRSPGDSSFPERSPAPVLHEPKECRSCGHPIFWCQVIDGLGAVQRRPDGKARVMPVDFFPDAERGNVVLADRGGTIVARVLGPDDAQAERDKAWALNTEPRLRTAHFVSCPQRDSWRRR